MRNDIDLIAIAVNKDKGCDVGIDTGLIKAAGEMFMLRDQVIAKTRRLGFFLM
jgi:hypothetical protein